MLIEQTAIIRPESVTTGDHDLHPYSWVDDKPLPFSSLNPLPPGHN